MILANFTLTRRIPETVLCVPELVELVAEVRKMLRDGWLEYCGEVGRETGERLENIVSKFPEKYS